MDIENYLNKILESEYLTFEEKEKQFRDLMTKHPEYEYEILTFLANLLFDYEKLDECIEVVEKVMTMEKNVEDKHKLNYVIADCYVDKKDYPKAIDALNRVLEYLPYEEQAYLYISLLYNKLAEYDKAFATLDRLSALDKIEGIDELFYSKGRIYFAKKDYFKALECFNKANLINSKNETFSYYIAMTYFEMEEWENAIEWYKNVIKLDSESAESYIYMSICYKNLGDTKTSDYFFEEGMNIDPDVLENIH